MKCSVKKTEQQWRDELTPEEYRVLRAGGTEPPFSGVYAFAKAKGVYICAGCGTDLFSSEAKFDSGSGWPSFFAPVTQSRLHEVLDTSLGMRRTEVRCATCDGHLGHVFPDGPPPSGLRYCINSVALRLEPAGSVQFGTQDSADQ